MSNQDKLVYKCLLPNLLEIQRASYCWFLEKGLIQELNNFSAIQNSLRKLKLNFATKFYSVKHPRYTLEEAKRLDVTYSVRIFIQAELMYLTGGESQKKKILLGDIPLMTDNGTFLVNGIERIIINQIVRSPGVYYRTEKDKNNVDVYCASLISNRGTWIKLEIDKDDFISIKIDKAKKFSIYIFLLE
jgi:DNA-directed RNA polymerase subunit beta